MGDPRVVRSIRKGLRAGVSEDGQWSPTTMGTPQGAVISPRLAHICLRYVLDLWVQRWRKVEARGEGIIVRYADDSVLGFQHPEDAERLLTELRERMKRFALELHAEKTRLIEFGRFALANRKNRGERRPETFDFPGFTHIDATWRSQKGCNLTWERMRLYIRRGPPPVGLRRPYPNRRLRVRSKARAG